MLEVRAQCKQGLGSDGTSEIGKEGKKWVHQWLLEKQLVEYIEPNDLGTILS